VSCGAPVGLARRSVSTPCSSNRTCKSAASVSRTRHLAFTNGGRRPSQPYAQGRSVVQFGVVICWPAATGAAAQLYSCRWPGKPCSWWQPRSSYSGCPEHCLSRAIFQTMSRFFLSIFSVCLSGASLSNARPGCMLTSHHSMRRTSDLSWRSDLELAGVHGCKHIKTARHLLPGPPGEYGVPKPAPPLPGR